MKRVFPLMVLFVAWSTAWAVLPEAAPLNPVLMGADPHIMLVGDTVWLYATGYKQPNVLYAHSSTNLQDWERHGPILERDKIAWIKEDGAPRHALWAPCIAEKDGRWYLYFSVGPQNPTPSRIGVAVGDGPAGPFTDSGAPLLTGGNGFEAIDPMVFTDPKSGTTYLYAGGSAGAKLRVFELDPDRTHLGKEIPVETPPHFTEGTFMHERGGKYYLSYSSGSTVNASYSVHYAVSETPVGPWTYEGVILRSDKDHKGPGHHSFLHNPAGGTDFIVYHRWNHQRGGGPFNASRQITIDRVDYDADSHILPVVMTAGNIHLKTQPTVLPPGIVVHHVPQATGLYIGSPSLTVLPNGDYLAAHDYFGPESNEHECATATVHRSSDRGETWRKITELRCLFWPKVFTHRDAAYIMGVEKHHGRIVIRRSTDNGETWTEPKDTDTGLLTPEGQFHTAPMPVIEHEGRLWRAFEDASNGENWGERYCAGMLSIPVDADLLKADNWAFSNFIVREPGWLDGTFGGWLEGSAVVAPDGTMVDMLRVDTPGYPEKAAIVTVSADGKTASFDPTTGFVDFPGGAKKFTIRKDEQSGLYWSLATIVPPRHQDKNRPGTVRNTLALVCSPDLRHWETRCVVLYHKDTKAHGFQYVDWCFEGEDIIAVCRTAHDDGIGGARNNHDANFMTFHRLRNFRTLTLKDSVADVLEK